MPLDIDEMKVLIVFASLFKILGFTLILFGFWFWFYPPLGSYYDVYNDPYRNMVLFGVITLFFSAFIDLYIQFNGEKMKWLTVLVSAFIILGIILFLVGFFYTKTICSISICAIYIGDRNMVFLGVFMLSFGVVIGLYKTIRTYLKPTEKIQPEKPKVVRPLTTEELYDKLIFIIYGDRSSLEHKLKSLMKEGQSREEAIEKLAKKEVYHITKK